MPAGGAETPRLAEPTAEIDDYLWSVVSGPWSVVRRPWSVVGGPSPVVSGRWSVVKIGVVGPCGAGKSTLVRALRARGIAAREIAQEHSGVPAMWQRITRPDRLVYLDVSRETAERRLEQELPPGGGKK